MQVPPAIIFDLDGVLLDTEPLYFDTTQEILQPFGHTYTWEIKLKIMGQRGLEASQFILDHYQLPLTLEEYRHQFDMAFQKRVPAIALMPHAEELLQAIKQQGIKLGLATSSEEQKFHHKMQAHPQLLGHFDTVVLGADPECRFSKPAPDIFLVAARRLGVDPALAWAVEDSPNGMQAAKAAGMRVFALPDPKVPPELLTTADHILSQLKDLHCYFAT